MELYSQGVPFKNIAEELKIKFDVYQLPGYTCTATTVKKIIWYRDWKIAIRMKQLLSTQKYEDIMGRKQEAALAAQDLELDMVANLRVEYQACVHQLKGMAPGTKEYTQTVTAMKSLGDQIAKISGTDSIRKIEEFKMKEQIKKDFQPKRDDDDPQTITPTIISQ